MGHGRCPSTLRVLRRSVMLLFGILLTVHPSLPQPPLPLSLPAHMSVVPPAWRYLPMAQAELSPLFSNSSPFSYSQSLLMVPPPGQASKPLLRASYGPYSVTQLILPAPPPLSPPLWACLLSEGVERGRDAGGGPDTFWVNVLLQVRGEEDLKGACVTLHVFRETQEHKASCITQPPLGVCAVTLILPSDWFETQHLHQSHQGPGTRLRHTHHRRPAQRRERHQQRRYGSSGETRWHGNRRTDTGATLFHSGRRFPDAEDGTRPLETLRYQHGPPGDTIQMYFSSSGPVADLKSAPHRCVGDRQGQGQLFYLGSAALPSEDRQHEGSRTTEEEACLGGHREEELHVDPNVLIRYHKGPIRIGQRVRVSVSLRGNFSAEFVVIRLKVKRGLVSMVAQRTLTSDLWAVTLERTQGANHDTISIICHKQAPRTYTHSSLHQQVVCLSVAGLRRSFGVAMTVLANWWVEYSGRTNPYSPQRGAVISFSFTDRQIIGIAPITESDTIINTAILTGEPVSLPVIVLAVSHDGEMSDVTAAVRCQSNDDDIIKVSSDCSSLFVDGSESGVGSTGVGVVFHLGLLSGTLALRLWTPSVPLRVSVSDPVLNAIHGWDQHTEHGCTSVFQRSTIQVLTQFTAQDSQGKITHLMDSSDWLVDVTELVSDWLRVEDPQVAFLGKQNNLIGLEPGRTSLQVVSRHWDGVLGSCNVTVTTDPVTLGDLSVQLVSGLGMSITASPAHPSVVTATVTGSNVLYTRDQEASASVWLQFADDTASLLTSFTGVPFSLKLSSLAESVVSVTPGPAQRVIARGDGGGPLLRAELLVPECTERPVNFPSDVEGAEPGFGTRSLAWGSGWIRVDLDRDFLQPIGGEDVEEGEEFEPDAPVESDGDSNASNFDPDVVGGEYAPGVDYYGRDALERAALTPGAVHPSPSRERGEGGGEGRRQGGAGGLDAGVSTILSLIGLFGLLFLVNRPPCAPRDRGRGEEKPVGTETGEGGREGEGEGEEKEGEEKEKEGEEKGEEERKELEIIC